MKLVLPTVIYKESFLEALDEFQKEKRNDRVDYYELDSEKLRSHFASYVDKTLAQSRGEQLPEGYVSQTTYWLIDNNEFIGRVSIRHTLTKHLLEEGGHVGYDIRPSKRNMGYGKKILALALKKTKTLGLMKVLVTCDETNIASRKIIEENGGVLENKLKLHKDKPAKLRFWIEPI